jgi:hypothetical protein
LLGVGGMQYDCNCIFLPRWFLILSLSLSLSLSKIIYVIIPLSLTISIHTILHLHYLFIGLELWEKGRQEWLTQANPSNHHNNYNHNNHNHNGGNSNGGGGGVHKGAIDLNIDDVIDCIVSNRWRTALKGAKDKGTFATPVPLPQMIDILTDLWEAEGLDN